MLRISDNVQLKNGRKLEEEWKKIGSNVEEKSTKSLRRRIKEELEDV